MGSLQCAGSSSVQLALVPAIVAASASVSSRLRRASVKCRAKGLSISTASNADDDTWANGAVPNARSGTPSVRSHRRAMISLLTDLSTVCVWFTYNKALIYEKSL